MNAIRSLAESRFDGYDRFLKADYKPVQSSVLTEEALRAAEYSRFQQLAIIEQVKPQLLTIKNAANREAQLSLVEIDEEHMQRNLSLPDSQPLDASLSLVVIPHSTQNWSFDVSKEAFTNVFHSCRLDTAALELFRYPIWGSFEFHQQDDCATYYVGNVLYLLCWSFDPKTTTTRGVIVPRSTFDAGKAKDTLARFVGLLAMQKEHIRTPHTLLFVQLIDLLYATERMMSRDLDKLAQIERITGHGLWTRNLDGLSQDADVSSEILFQLKEASKIISNRVVNTARQEKLLDIMSASYRDMSTKTAWLEDAYRRRGLEKQLELHEQEVAYRMEGMAHLKRRMEHIGPSLTYKMTRLNSQTSVINSLISHADARTSISMAQASMATAEAARKDASSMKTIAVMTMLFLPSTFLAALFAVPSLQWDQPGVIQSNFWVFWAMAVPLTVVVFVVWLILSGDAPYFQFAIFSTRKMES